jgi:hypothetical protein
LKWRESHEAEFKLLDGTTPTNLQLLKMKKKEIMEMTHGSLSLYIALETGI